MPADTPTSCLWNAATMELGALVCTGEVPSCQLCPVEDLCAWVAAGKPEADYTPRVRAGTARTARCAAQSWRCCVRRMSQWNATILGAGTTAATGASAA